MPTLTVIYKDPKTLRPREKNPRKHPKRQIEQLKRSITEFGFVRPERPALQRLLKDIELGAVDVVVVYKIDRLSRSLMDFAMGP